MKPKSCQKSIAAVLCVLTLVGSVRMGALAAGESYNWYCVHAKEHVQPRVGGELSFVEELDGYYIDHGHTAQEDCEKVMYLTFDAGYENGNVARVLDVLKEEDVTGAFFILGNLIQRNADLVKRMVAEGHTVCNHTVRHKDMSSATDEAFMQELRELETMFEELTGEKMGKYYRPPEGRFSKANLECAKSNGYKTVFWSFAYADWDNNNQPSCDAAYDKIISSTHNGEIILLHPTSATNAQIMGRLIDYWKSEGYRFGSLTELKCEA